MRNTKQAFTLVELIVVITILAILWTIAFISLQGYSADARNSKRNNDINSLAGQMNVKVTEWTSLLSFADDSTITDAWLSAWNISISWTWGTDNTNYDAWVPNYLVLGVKSDDFKDPDWDEYRVGLSTKKWGTYEFASSIENGSGERETDIVGTYNPRTQEVVTLSSAMTSTSAKLSASDYNKFFKGDYIEDATSSSWAQVLKVSSDLSTLTLDTALTATWIQLLASETSGLIAATGDQTTAITDGSTTNLPY